MFFEEEEEQPSRPIPKVTIVSAPGKPRRPDDWVVKHLQGEGGKPPDDEEDEKDEKEQKDKDQKRMEPCKVTGDDDEEELVDPQVRLVECCAKSEECSKLQEVLQACNERVNSKEKTNETCEMELFDFIHCINHCVTKDLFSYLK